MWVDAPRGRRGRHPLNPKPGAKLQEPLGEGTSRVTTSQPSLPFPPGSICISLEMPIFFLTPLSMDCKGSQKKKTLRLLFLTPESPHPQSTVPLHGRCFYATKVPLSLPRIVRAASTPTLFFIKAPILLQAPSARLKLGPYAQTRGPGSSQRGAPPPGNLRERRPLCACLDPPSSHFTALSPTSLSLQLALCTPTFLEEGNRDGSRQQRSMKGVVGPKGVLRGVRTLQVPAAAVESRRSSGTGLPWLAGRAPSKHGARVRSGRDGLGRAGV